MYVNKEREALTAKAQQGDVEAQYELAKMWEKGDVVHLVYAYFWYLLAAKHGHPKAASDGDAVGKNLSSMTRARQDSLVAAWKPTSAPTPPPRFYGDEKAEILSWLESWFKFQTDGNWEEDFGVKIQTLDNPGWSVRVDLAETYLEEKPFTEIREDRGANDWLTCRVKDGKFESFGDPTKLKRMLEVFRSWASSD